MKNRYIPWLTAVITVAVVFLVIPLPSPLFKETHSTIIRDREGNFLSGVIADDQQWRFPPRSVTTDKFREAIIYFEDRNFYAHKGIDFPAISRALILNIKNRRVVSGGSTISMQVIRLSRKGKERTLYEKIIEAILAVKLELKYSKEEILGFYTSYAPFGGNVVGLDAASWRYFAVEPELLSWGESAALAVLPNSPGLIYPGRNSAPFKDKRDRLLKTLNINGVISDMELSLALEEELPGKPHPLPRKADHLLLRAIKDGHKGENIISTIDKEIQQNSKRVVDIHHNRLIENHISNIAAVVMDINSGNILSYIGNTRSEGLLNSPDVDIAASKRSTGSLLKPILYALALDDGLITPEKLLSDTPLFYTGFSPRNFNNEYSGAVNADIALQKSLNIPFVTMLYNYNYSRFNHVLKRMGLPLKNDPDYYGLSIILGGSDASLWDLTGVYGSMARSLNNYFIYPEETPYSIEDYHSPRYIENRESPKEYQSGGIISAGALYTTFKTMEKVSRPTEDASWELYESALPLSWKTGTSFGFRDAWAIGFTSNYLVGVWVGNADGEGRPDLVGVKAAAPVMFDIFHILPRDRSFLTPVNDMKMVEICVESGELKGQFCIDTKKVLVPKNSAETENCTYHKLVHLNKEETLRVNSDNYPVTEMVHKSWFVLPPVEEWYYRLKNSSYKPLPPLAGGEKDIMSFVYPVPGSRITIPRELDGERGSAVLEVAHRDKNITLYWHLDRDFIGKTEGYNRIKISPTRGDHKITVMDSNGNYIEMSFTVVN